MKQCFLLFALLVGMQVVYAQKTDQKLQRKVEELIKGFQGDIGIYVKSLKTGKVVAVNADSVFPTASMV